MKLLEYYVYEWFRPDTNECFYVGKGCGQRAWSYSNRNYIFTEVINELIKKRLKPKIFIYKGNLAEEQALKIEGERIAYWTDRFTQLTNLSRTYTIRKIRCGEYGGFFPQKEDKSNMLFWHVQVSKQTSYSKRENDCA